VVLLAVVLVRAMGRDAVNDSQTNDAR
jgi:hypothetical protein